MPRDGAQGECKKGANYAQMHMSSLKSSPVHSKQPKVMTTTSNCLKWKTHTHTPLWQFGTNMTRFCRYEIRMLVINPESGAPHSGLECVGTTRNPPSGEANMFRSNMIHHVPMLLGSSPIVAYILMEFPSNFPSSSVPQTKQQLWEFDVLLFKPVPPSTGIGNDWRDKSPPCHAASYSIYRI